jgi:hypothetical protein
MLSSIVFAPSSIPGKKWEWMSTKPSGNTSVMGQLFLNNENTSDEF